jgi:opacity protein-like surface antigen
VRSSTAIAALIILPAIANAQGTLSTQGFGYPVGSFSTRAVGAGGAFGEFDALSPINPASLAGLQRSVLAAQAEPEYRTLRVGSVSERNRIQRVPLLSAAFPLPRNFVIGISGASFLDRTFSTRTTGEADLGDEIVATRDEFDVRGSMSDLRAAVGYRVNERLAFGLGGHLFVGSNDVIVARRFEDSIRFGSVVDSSTITFQGTGVSFGAEYRVVKNLSLSASYRVGNDIEARSKSGVQGKAKVPSRLGASARFDGIPGSLFAVGFEQVNWSSLEGLGSDNVEPRDAMNWHAGVEVAGPQVRQLPVQFRLGYARTQLPFGVDGRDVNEQRIAGGIGIPLERSFAAAIDLSVQRVMRSLSSSNIRENAWRFGLGIQIRP